MERATFSVSIKSDLENDAGRRAGPSKPAETREMMLRTLFALALIFCRPLIAQRPAVRPASKFCLSLVFVALFSTGANSVAQQKTPISPAYDVVVVRLNDSLTGGTSVNMDEATFQAKNVPLKHLMVIAYGIREGLIFGLPKWATSSRFDITAKITDPDSKTLRSISREERQAMLASLLEDRFHLKLHTEVKTLPVYELVVAKGGPKLTTSALPPPDAKNPDPLRIGNWNVQNTDIAATGVALSDLAGNLSLPLDRTVIDKTGLTGRYDFRLKWTAEGVATGATDDPPDLFTAIQEQLGLKLQAAKGPVKTLVVDDVKQPTGN
jgi:uncharacterized protein (TIGR03435 family)